VAVGGLLFTVAASALIGAGVEPSYEARSSLLLVAPPVQLNQEGEEVPTNPFLLSGTAERVAASSVMVVTESQEWAAMMQEEGAKGDYEYELAAEAPIIDVTTVAATSDEALQTLEVATRLFEERFEENQRVAGAPTDRLINSEVLSSTEEPAKLVGSQVRATLAMLVLGLAATATVMVLLEALAPDWTPQWWIGRNDQPQSLLISRLGRHAATGDGARG
jgi:hypothetical protein